MSVDYEAFIGIGWVISAEEKERLIDANLKMIEDYPDADIMCIEDEFSYINSYYGDGEVFLGKTLVSIDSGEYMNLTAVGSLLTPEELERFVLTYEKIFEACGEPLGIDSKWYNPQIYLIHRIW